MPLRAIIDGVDVIAPLLDDEAWEALRKRVSDDDLRVVLPCCNVEGYLRKSKYGTKHFAHKQGAECVSKGETLEHLRAKADIVLACQSAGYHALTEVIGDDWRADVLAARGSARIAFEVQWSFLRLRDALMRQRRYERDHVRGCWFFRRPPAPLHRDGFDGALELQARRELPLFHLYVNADGSFSVALNNRLHRLREFVTALLSWRVRFCEMARSETTRLRLHFREMHCPACGQRAHVYAVDATQTAACGIRFKAGDEASYRFHPDVRAAVAAYRVSEVGRELRMGTIKPRPDAQTGIVAFSFGCPACDEKLDPEALSVSPASWANDAGLDTTDVTLREPASGTVAHWCCPGDGDFCCGREP